jgi:hypothetical protein
MGVIGAAMDPWNIMTPILMLAIGAGHSVQILKRYYEEHDRACLDAPSASPLEQNRMAVVEATTQVGKVMLAAGTIAALSFGSLVTFQLTSGSRTELHSGAARIARTAEFEAEGAGKAPRGLRPPARTPGRARSLEA